MSPRWGRHGPFFHRRSYHHGNCNVHQRGPNLRFSPGATVMTVGVANLVEQGRLNPSPYLRRHLSGDWGDLDENDRRSNDAALASGEARLLFRTRSIPI